MKHIFIYILMIFAIYPTVNAEESKLKVLTTIKPIHSLVSLVTKGVLTPILLIDKTNCIHDYTLKPSDAIKLTQSDIIFYVDNNLESFISGFQNKTLIQLSSIVKLLPSRRERNYVFSEIKNKSTEYDLHIWLNIDNAKKIIIYVKDLLSKIDKKNAPTYKTNSLEALKKLDDLKNYIDFQLKDVKNVPFIVTHDAYQYFEKYFGLKSLATLSLSDEITISAKNMVKIKNLVNQNKVKCIFSEHEGLEKYNPVFDNKAKIHILDPLGMNVPANENTYFAIIKNLAYNMKMCLEK